jgi:hypothetical protein
MRPASGRRLMFFQVLALSPSLPHLSQSRKVAAKFACGKRHVRSHLQQSDGGDIQLSVSI